MRKTVRITITLFVFLYLAAMVQAQTRLAPANNPNAVAGSGQSEIIINASNAEKDIAVWVNGTLVAHLSPGSTEKIIVPNGRNTVEAAESTVSRSGQWSTSTKRQVVVNSSSNRVTVSLTTRYGTLTGLTASSPIAITPAPTTAAPPVVAAAVPAGPVNSSRPRVLWR